MILIFAKKKYLTIKTSYSAFFIVKYKKISEAKKSAKFE